MAFWGLGLRELPEGKAADFWKQYRQKDGNGQWLAALAALQGRSPPLIDMDEYHKQDVERYAYACCRKKTTWSFY